MVVSIQLTVFSIFRYW